MTTLLFLLICLGEECQVIQMPTPFSYVCGTMEPAKIDAYLVSNFPGWEYKDYRCQFARYA